MGLLKLRETLLNPLNYNIRWCFIRVSKLFTHCLHIVDEHEGYSNKQVYGFINDKLRKHFILLIEIY